MTKTEKWYDTPEVDALLEEAAQDTSPLVTISTPEDLEALRQRLGLTSDTAPCFICGYNGSGYYQPDTHPCAERYHRLYKPSASPGIFPNSKK